MSGRTGVYFALLVNWIQKLPVHLLQASGDLTDFISLLLLPTSCPTLPTVPQSRTFPANGHFCPYVRLGVHGKYGSRHSLCSQMT